MSTQSLPIKYLTFISGSELFAIDIRMVREIIQKSDITVVPLMPDFLRGVMNLRGSVVPVVDLQARLGRRRITIGKKTCVVIIDKSYSDESHDLGMLVDAVCEVIEIEPQNIEPPPPFGTSVTREYLQGIAKVEEEFVLILAPDMTLNIDDMTKLVEQ